MDVWNTNGDQELTSIPQAIIMRSRREKVYEAKGAMGSFIFRKGTVLFLNDKDNQTIGEQHVRGGGHGSLVVFLTII